MTDIATYAQLADAVYEDDPRVAGWTRTAFKRSGSGLTDAFQGAAFSKDGEIVFACKGTSQGREKATDILLGVGFNTVQFGEARAWIAATSAGSAATVTICGHSLGGAIAQVVGNRLRNRFITFNAPGIAVMSRNLGEMMTSPLGAVRMVNSVTSAFFHPFQAARDVGGLFYRVSGVNYVVGNDAVGHVGVHYGQVINIFYSGSGANVVGTHFMSTVHAELARSGIGRQNLVDVLT